MSTTPGNRNNISNLTGTATNLIDFGAGTDWGLSITGTFTISGLTAGNYTIEVVSARTTFNYPNTFTVNGGTLANRTQLGTAVVTR